MGEPSLTPTATQEADPSKKVDGADRLPDAKTDPTGAQPPTVGAPESRGEVDAAHDPTKDAEPKVGDGPKLDPKNDPTRTEYHQSRATQFERENRKLKRRLERLERNLPSPDDGAADDTQPQGNDAVFEQRATRKIAELRKRNPDISNDEILDTLARDPTLNENNGMLTRDETRQLVREEVAPLLHDIRSTRDLSEAKLIVERDKVELKKEFNFDFDDPKNRFLSSYMKNRIKGADEDEELSYVDIYRDEVVPWFREMQQQLGVKAETSAAAQANAETLRTGPGTVPTSSANQTPPIGPMSPDDRRRAMRASFEAAKKVA